MALFTLLLIYSCKKEDSNVLQSINITTNAENLIEVSTSIIPSSYTPYIDKGIITLIALNFIEERHKLPDGKRNIIIDYGQIGSDWLMPCDSCQKLISGLMYTIFPKGMDNKAKGIDTKANGIAIWVGMTSLSGNRSLIVATLDYQDSTNANLVKNNFFERTSEYTRCYTELSMPYKGSLRGTWGFAYSSFCQ